MTKEGIGSISEGISSVLKNWNINANDSTATLDKLFRAWQKTQIPVGELMRQLTEFGPMLRQMGYSFDESTAMLAKFQFPSLIGRSRAPTRKMRKDVWSFGFHPS